MNFKKGDIIEYLDGTLLLAVDDEIGVFLKPCDYLSAHLISPDYKVIGHKTDEMGS